MSQTPPPPQTSGLDDSPSVVEGPKKMQLTTMQKIGIAGLIGLVFLSFIWIDHALQTNNANEPDEVSVQPNRTAFRPAPLLQVQEEAPPLVQPEQTKKEGISAEESPLFAYTDRSLGPTTLQGGATRTLQTAGEAAAAFADGSANPLAAQLTPTPTLVGQAALLPNPDMLITKGTIIPCTLQTAINTDLPGFVKCVLPEPVRSTTGNVVLLDRGTTIVGEIQSNVAKGKKRVFILWDRAETPQNAIVSLASPGADELGRSGVPGSIDTHFWQRFGAALMFTVLDGGLQTGAAYAGASGSDAETFFNSAQSNGQQLAETSLRSSIDIPPTLEKNQGDNVTIFVANDIDFSSVYDLGLVR